MGEAVVVYRINPCQDKIKEIKEKLSSLGAKEILEEEIGFGIVSLKTVFVLEDKPDCVGELEKKIEKIDGINSVQVEGTSLI